MLRTGVAIVGGGQAGLAMSRCLSDLGIEHVVLERGDVTNRWRTDGWDSLRLLTPNWMTRLPGHRYRGDNPDGFMAASELVSFLDEYARMASAPLQTNTTVERVEVDAGRFRVSTNRGTWCAASVVLATGYCDIPAVPALHRHFSAAVEQLVPRDYQNPQQLPPGGVLIVGASATGIQIADELQRAGRDVTIAVGQHTRLPRDYRGRDILWWLDRTGILCHDDSHVFDFATSRDQPSLQLVGRPDRASLDLFTLKQRGVRVVGRLLDVAGDGATFGDDLLEATAGADWKLAGLLRRIDDYIDQSGCPALDREPFAPGWQPFTSADTSLNLRAERIRTVIWATGYRRSYPWLRIPVLDDGGEIVHRGGITPQPGLYILGMNFLRRRNSSFLDGVGTDARELAAHLARRLANRSKA